MLPADKEIITNIIGNNHNSTDVTRLKADKLEIFVNDYLKEDLNKYDKQLQIKNNELLEYIQLKNMIETIKNDLFNDDNNSFKTKMNIGGNFFMQAKVPKTDKILVNVGLNHYVEFTMDEGLKFIEMKVNILNKQIDIIREESIKTKANIKLALMCIGEQRKLN